VDVSPHEDEYLDLCAAQAIGTLDPEDRARLERHLDEGCEVCRSALREFGRAAVLLAHAVPEVSPSPSLRSRVLDVVRAEAASIAPRREQAASTVIPVRPRRLWVWAAAAGWAAAAVLAVTVGTFWETVARLRDEIRIRDARVSELSGQLAVEHRWVSILSAPGAKVAEMTLTPQGQAELQGRAVYDPPTGRALVFLQNAVPPSGKDYQLWAIRGGVPHDLGLIRADAAGLVAIPLEGFGDPATTQAFAVSLEPKGGSPNPIAPSGPVVLIGPLRG
jgi:anti-sigma-K factor RskA